MRRLCALLLAFVLPGLAHALDYRLEPRQIARDTWVLEGSTDNFSQENGGNIVNIGFIVTDAGVVLIDTGPSRAYGEALRKAIAGVTEKPVIRAYITHHHPDHALGSQAFRDVAIAALPGTTRLLTDEGDALAENMYRLVGDWMRGTEVVLPGSTVTEGVTEIGGHRLRLLSLRGHSGADLAILDETTGVLFAGDLLFYQRALTTPHSPGLAVWQQDVDTLRALPWKVVVPGHGPVTEGPEPFEQTRDYLGWLDALLRAGVAAGADMNDLIGGTTFPERFSGISLKSYELVRSISHLYPVYEREALARRDRAASP